MQVNAIEALHIMQEEAAEVIQAISKVNRFGLNGKHPTSTQTNLELLEEEIGDMLCMVNLLVKFGVLSQQNIENAQINKVDKLKRWSKIFHEDHTEGAKA
jgi:NTP pyrophosphatase (non-canonical NTP hydrolase)